MAFTVTANTSTGFGITLGVPSIPFAGPIEDWESGIDSGVWNNWGGSPYVTLVGGVLTLTHNPAATNYYGVVSQNSYDVTGKQVTVKITSLPTVTLPADSEYSVGVLVLEIDTANRYFWSWESDALQAIKVTGGSYNYIDSIALGSIQYVRIREDSGTVYFDYTDDGITWSNLTSIATTGVAVTDLFISMANGNWATVGATYTAELDDINILPSGLTDYDLIADSGSIAITGTSASLERSLEVSANNGVYTLTGTSANLEYNRRLTASAGSVAITGTDASIEKNYRLVADTGVYAITGINASLETSREVFAESGSVVITGTDATFRKSVNLVADSGSVSVTGTSASLEVSKRLVASSGSVVITGTDATFRKSINFTASSGAFSVTGTNANLEYNKRLVADSGVYAITGTNASLETSREVLGGAGSFSITGTDATLKVARNITATSGSVSITGQAVDLEIARRLAVDPGAFTITGTDADLIYDETNDYFLTADLGAFVITGTNTRAILDLDTFPVGGKQYYIDSNGNLYWVIDPAVGIVEKV